MATTSRAKGVKGIIPFEFMGHRFPTADQVATAIVAACRETGGYLLPTAIRVARGERDLAAGKSAGYPISRARVYAALALEALFDVGGTAISRMVGAANPSRGTLLPMIRSNIENNALRWYDPAALERVKAAVRACSSGPVPPQPPGGNAQPAPRPAPAPVVVKHTAPVVTQPMRAAASAFSCEQCGKPKSVGSAQLCRDCYRGLTPRAAVAERARQVERAIEAPDRFAGLGAQEHTPAASSGKRALQEMLANAAAETARQQARQRRE
jgi:hypothetical protein